MKHLRALKLFSKLSVQNFGKVRLMPPNSRFWLTQFGPFK